MLSFKKYLKIENLIFLVLIVSLFLRLFRLDFPEKYVFDEVYHGFTAREYLLGHKEAWEWWTKPPEGVAYEWTHPPLAKEIMAESMFILRTQDNWAYRLPGVLLGVLSIYLVYLLGLKLLKNQWASLIAAFVFSIDGLNFVQSRTGMNDIYLVTFMLASLLLLLNKKYFFSAILLGLSLSSKWAAIYLLPMVFILLLKDRQFKKMLYFILIPPIIYLVSYIPFFTLGHSFDQFIQLQQQMWWYHTGLKAHHDYSSAWWSWPLNLYPVWYFVDYQKDSIANIFASGNPAVFWTGFVSIILTLLEVIRKKSINLLIILFGFFVFWLPWAFSPRIMFLYHYSPSIPFMSLALAHQLAFSFKNKKGRSLIFTLLILMFLSFILIYPFLTAIPLPREFVKIFFSTNIGKDPF